MLPQRQVIAQTAAQTGDVIIPTAKVSNSMRGDKEFAFTLAVAGEADIAAIPLFPGAWRTATERSTIKAGVTFSSDQFDSFGQMVQYFSLIHTNIYGMRVETDDTDNFGVGQTLTFIEKDPAGDETPPVRLKLSKKRTPVGNGFSEVIEMTEKDLNIVLWPGLDVELSNIKTATEMTFYFSVRGWNKVKELNALKGNIIG